MFDFVTEINILLTLIVIFAGVLTSLYGKYKNYARTTYLHVNRKKDFEPFVSVIVPVYNEVEVIENTIRTIEKSFYERFEIIVIDDNSNDGTYELLKKLENEYSNLIVRRKNGIKGKAQSLNEAFAIAKGDIILILDADSRIPPEYISTHISCFSRDDIQMIFTGFEPLNYKPKNFAHKIQDLFFSFAKDIIFSNIFVNMIFMGNGVFFKRSLLEKVMPIDPNTLVDDFSIAMELQKLKVKEYFSIYPWLRALYANNLRDLWKQHFRWYYGGYREMIKRFFKGGGKTYIFSVLLYYSPVILSLLFVLTNSYIFLFLLWYLFIYSYSTFVTCGLLNPNRRTRIIESFYLALVVIVFQLSVLIPSTICALFMKKREWYKTSREKI